MGRTIGVRQAARQLPKKEFSATRNLTDAPQRCKGCAGSVRTLIIR